MRKIEWIRREDLSQIIPLLQLLNEDTDMSVLQKRLRELSNDAYHCAGAFEDDQLVGICGVWELYKHYVGKHIELDNVVLLPEYRGKGIGEEMVAWIEAWAKEQGFVASELNCYVVNSAGMRFWLNQGYKILGFHCQKKW